MPDMMSLVRWNLLSPSTPDSAEAVVQVLLQNRGLKTSKVQQEFLHPKHPRDLTLTEVGLESAAMHRAVKLILATKEHHQKVLIFGDYDADGITATAILWETLHGLGVTALPFIPDRQRHGYGLSPRAVAEILASPQKPDLIVTVDNGIVAHAAVQQLRDAGIKIIITDHHQLDAQGPPSANVVVHTTKLCGATVSWFLSRALDPHLPDEKLALCGIATIADQVPLLDANRSFAVHGLEALRHTKRPGLLGLMSAAGVEQSKVDSYTVNYGLAPRINAMGRLDNPLDALRALCTTNQARAAELTTKLHQTNTARQELTSGMLATALQMAEAWQDQRVIVVSSVEFHEGVIGLVAGKLVETFAKPAIVIAVGELTAKGSARSVAGVNVTELLRFVQEELLDVGGHPMAAGFSLSTANIASFTAKITQRALESIPLEALELRLDLECTLPSSLVGVETWEAIHQLEPWGSANPLPVFEFPDWEVLRVEHIGATQQHLKLRLRANSQLGSKEIEALQFHAPETSTEVQVGDKVSIVGSLKNEEWNGRRKLQIMVKDLHSLGLYTSFAL